MSIDKNVRWNKNRIAGYNKLFNFVIGQRGVGKTYCLKATAINNFIKKGERCAWLMRYKTEIDAITDASKFFDDVLARYPDYEFKIEGGTGFIKGGDFEEWCRFISFKALSESSLKAISDPTVSIMVFDEFIPLPGIHYLKNEVERFLEYYLTISRGRDVKCYFLANNVAAASPYFSYFGVHMPEEGELTLADEIAIENVKNDPYKEAMHKTRFGNLVKGTHYEKYSINNESFEDVATFITDRPKNARCIVQLLTSMGPLYLWIAQPSSLHISSRGDPTCISWAMDEKSHKENTQRMDFAGTYATRLIKSAYRQGMLFFDSPETKSTFFAVCGSLLLRK